MRSLGKIGWGCKMRPQDKELTDGRANAKPAEAVPVDNWGRSLQRQDAPQPTWGASTEAALKAKRGPSGKSRHPGF